MRNFLRKLFTRATPRILSAGRSSLTLEQWRENTQLVAASRKLFSDPHFLLMLDVLRNESPVNMKLPKLNVQPSDRIAHASEIEGYQLCLNNLEAFARLAEPEIDLGPPTFAPPESEPEPPTEE